MVVTITATDTGVGKTLASCLLAQAAELLSKRCWYLKPFQTGCPPDDDSATLQAMNLSGLELLTPWYALSPPQAPLRAWQELGQKIPEWSAIQKLARDVRPEFGIIEGAGGVLVPITAEKTMLDLFSEFHRAVTQRLIIVCRTELGTLNHTALTVQALRQKDLKILGLFAVGPSNPKTLELLSQQNNLPILHFFERKTPDEPITPERIKAESARIAHQYWFGEVTQ